MLDLRSGLQFPEPDNEEALRLAAVIRALTADARHEAAAHLAPLVGRTRKKYPIEELPRLDGARRLKGTGVLTSSPPLRTQAEVFAGAGFTCAFCCRWTIPVGMLRLISTAFVADFPYIPSWKGGARAYWDISTSLDHLMPVSSFERDGDYQSRTNLVTVCYRCNEKKSNIAVTDLGWEVGPRTVPGWTGAVELYEPLWERLGRPNQQYHRPWINAYAAALGLGIGTAG